MKTEEVCGACKHWDKESLLCCNPDSQDYLEGKRWSESCDDWEEK